MVSYNKSQCSRVSLIKYEAGTLNGFGNINIQKTLTKNFNICGGRGRTQTTFNDPSSVKNRSIAKSQPFRQDRNRYCCCFQLGYVNQKPLGKELFIWFTFHVFRELLSVCVGGGVCVCVYVCAPFGFWGGLRDLMYK